MNRSPFRYPGGKSRLAKYIVPYIEKMLGNTFADVFVGGGSILLDIANKHPEVKLVANDADDNIGAFWKMVSGKGSPDVLTRSLKNRPTVKLFKQLRQITPRTLEEKAYHGVFFNRTTFSGIARSGPIGGYDNQDNTEWKIDCRYNSERLCREFLELRENLALRLTSHSVDALSLIPKLENITLYLDPPYYEKGNSLYSVGMSKDHHKALAKILRERDNWVLSYDDHEFIRELYGFANIYEKLKPRYSIAGKKTSWDEGKRELLITRRPTQIHRIQDGSSGFV